MCIADVLVLAYGVGVISLTILGVKSFDKYRKGKKETDTKPHTIESQDSIETK